MVTTCGSGVTACVILFGAHLLGKEDVRLYDGSWSEWGADPATPKAQGAGVKRRKPETRLVEAGRRKEWTQGLVNPAVWRASTILFDSVEEMHAANPPREGVLHYGRNGTPTTWALCEALTELEPGAAMTRLYPSGAAAVAGALLVGARGRRRAADGRQRLRADPRALRRRAEAVRGRPPVITIR